MTKLQGLTYKTHTGCGSLYVTINEKDGKPYEIFLRAGKNGGCAASQTESIGRLLSVSLQNGVPMAKLAKQLGGISCHARYENGEEVTTSCSDAVSKVIREYIASSATQTHKNAQKIELVLAA
jgi:ribonucleoside-diphosphate reductase alpha chain